jgi:hypothetical protein
VPPPRPVALYGGRTATWWQERVERLRRGGDEERALLEPTLDRARANGLVVTEREGALRVEEPPPPPAPAPPAPRPALPPAVPGSVP